MTGVLAVLLGLTTLVVPGSVAATEAGPVEVEAADLLSDPEAWSGRRVIVTGELVGDYSARDEGVWVQLNDDEFVESPVAQGGAAETTSRGVGALIPHAEFAGIEGPPGRYGRYGPRVRLEGVFMHSDPARQGETYLAVDAARTLEPGREYPLPGPDPWLAVGAILVLAAIAITLAGRRESTPAE